MDFDTALIANQERPLVQLFKEKALFLVGTWNDIGLEEDMKSERMEMVIQHLSNLLDQMMEDEADMKIRLVSSIKESKEDLVKLTRELCLPAFEPDNNQTVLVQEKELRTKVEELVRMKHQRLKELRLLREAEKELVQLLKMPSHDLSVRPVPSEIDLAELQEHINMLKTEKEVRFTRFVEMRDEIVSILNKLSIMPKPGLEEEIVCEPPEKFILSKQNIHLVKETLIKFRTMEQDKVSAKEELLKKLQLLWDRLSIEKHGQEIFIKKHEDYSLETFKAIEAEIDRCEILKRQNLKKFVEKVVKELEAWKTKCFYMESLKHPSIDEGDYNDELLNKLENEALKFKSFYEKYHSMLEKISRREQLWVKQEEFDKKANDPNRFNNRGGNLLKEERQRKLVEKELPRLEDDILNAVDDLREENDPFSNKWADLYVVHVEIQHHLRRQDKENEKLERKQRQADQVNVTLKRKGETPGKNTPLTKVRKVQTPVSAGGALIFRSPASVLQKKRSPKTATPKTRRQKKVLVERTLNFNDPESTQVLAQDNPGTSVFSVTSITDFTTGLLKKQTIANSTQLVAPAPAAQDGDHAD